MMKRIINAVSLIMILTTIAFMISSCAGTPKADDNNEGRIWCRGLHSWHTDIFQLEKKDDDFFDLATTALVPVDGEDIYYTPKDAENFDEVFGKNTDYVIDPEECLADNFGFLLAYGMEGPEGKGYPSPDIITSIEDVLKQ